ncbi:hypothetical protein [Ferrovum sp.]|uniref:hypothetical protein n=1 Tax=Ferrovum sp. TaxID=2609467 RepID=UPI00260458F4|nr:hypothetical protein [Ferrovum sp.]
MKKLLLLILFPLTAFASPKSDPGFVFGQIPTPAQWNSYFDYKLDYNRAGLAINLGGTGAVAQQFAINNLAGAVTSGSYLRGNGTNAVMAPIQAADVPVLNQNTTGTASNVTGTVAIANGGTGATTQAAAQTALGIVPTLSGTSTSIGGAALVAGGTATTTVNIAGATTSMGVVVSPTTFPGAGIDWSGYVSSSGVVTVVVTAIIAATPTASTYNVRVLQ